MRFTLEDSKDRSGAPCGRPVLGPTRLFLRGLFPARRQSNSCLPGFGETNRDGLLGRTRAMFSLPDVFHLLADKFPSLGARGSPFAGLFFRALDRLCSGIKSSFHSQLFRVARVAHRRLLATALAVSGNA